MDSVVHPQASRRTRRLEKVKVRTGVGSSQNELHHKAREDTDDIVLAKEKSLGNRHRQKGNRAKVDELVKHMSNLPGYLQLPERGENLQENVLNVGVLDWTRLEKWKQKQKHPPAKACDMLLSSTRKSSLERTAESSTSSDLVRTGTHAEQHSSRCSSLKLSHKDGLSQSVKPSVKNVVHFQDSKAVSKNAIHGQKKIPFPNSSLGRNHSDTMLDKGKGKHSDQKITSETRNAAANLKYYGVSLSQKEDVRTWDGPAKKTKELQESDVKRKNMYQRIIPEMGALSSKLGGYESYDVPLSSKGKTSVCNDKTEKRGEELQKIDINPAHQHCPVEENNIVLPPPKEWPQNGIPVVLQLSKPRASCDKCMKKAHKVSFLGDFSTKEINFSELCSEVPHSCPLPSVVETNTTSNMMPNGPISINSVRLSSVPSHMLPCSNQTEDLLYEDKFIENKLERKLTSSSSDTSKTSYQEDVELENRKGRNPSPIRRFSFSLGRLGRSFSFKESSAIPQLSSTYATVKSGPVSSETSDCSDNTNREKASSHNRARSSPLRRLLDPILKHKEANPRHSAEAVRPLRANISSFGSRPINVSDSLQHVKCEASWVQAFLQLTIKNGHPLFKFSVDNNSNCLAATMKNLSGKDDLGQNFTFYCVNEIKRKTGSWMSQGSKDKRCGYVYNVIGQMKVSGSDFSDVNGQYMLRESVLFGVEIRQTDQESPKFIPNRELAAAVVKIPCNDLSHVEQKSDVEVMEKGCIKCSPEDRCPYSWEDSTIVILPGGVHSSPSKGKPSPLIDRWKSGGSCDCGGWDVGCKLRVLSNQNKCCRIPETSTACVTLDNFELFAEGGAQQSRPVFTLAPAKDGYSIEFNTSLSFLQAFFISVVVISSRKPSDLAEAKVCQQPNLNENNGGQVTGPPKYAPNPPQSPVGRV